MAGFTITAIGMILLLTLVRAHSAILTWVPGLLLFGAGVGGHADLVGQCGPVQLPRHGPRRNLRAVP